jgi:hypothetical protein
MELTGKLITFMMPEAARTEADRARDAESAERKAAVTRRLRR